ncbi:pectinesterase [Musa troglodytarum]|uniref:Pectinesterase n=1 Tax=Musa troglodytarum TaxID=320322 RepID=A0A9E7L2H8_9LILI|nr:pectinesterase [Musa troglodytarum]
MAYQQTCIDDFPEGELKFKMRAAMDFAMDITSNALAISGKISSFLNLIQATSFSRRLLEAEPSEPGRVSHGDRRLLETPATLQFTPNASVAKDGNGNFTTISETVAQVPRKFDFSKYVMYVKEGVYNEYMEVDVHAWNLTMYGDGPDKTIVTGSKNYVDGVRTFKSATFDAVGDGFMAVSMAFENTAGPAKGQAVALRVQAARSIFLHCRMQAYQDTLYAHSHRQFYRNCLISGTIDFIFGDAAAAAAVFQKCFLTMRRPQAHHGTVVFAQSRVRVEESTGFVSQNCSFVAVLAFTGATHPRLPVQRLLHHHHRP